MKSSLPHFIIVGAMKCGTTSLHRWMGTHPRIARSSLKETNYFARNHDKGLAWYKSLFGTEKDFAFEASPNYAKRHLFEGVPERMATLLPQVKIIYMLRDPIERIRSHYGHNVAVGRERRPISEVAKDDAYLKTSMYHFQLQAYLDYFPREQILLVPSEALWREPAGWFGEILSFVDITCDIDPGFVERTASLLTPTSPSPAHRRRNAQTLQLTDADKERLVAALITDVQALRKYSGKSFTEWSIP
jgi:Sulfotransferase domain